MKKILRFTLRYKIRFKVSNSAPKSVPILCATEAISFESNTLEHKWSWVCKSIGLFSPTACYVFSLCEDDSNVSKLISLKTVSKPTNHNTLLSLSKRKISLGVSNFCNLSNRAGACLVTNPLSSYQLNNKNIYCILNNWKTNGDF